MCESCYDVCLYCHQGAVRLRKDEVLYYMLENTVFNLNQSLEFNNK